MSEDYKERLQATITNDIPKILNSKEELSLISDEVTWDIFQGYFCSLAIIISGCYFFISNIRLENVEIHWLFNLSIFGIFIVITILSFCLHHLSHLKHEILKVTEKDLLEMERVLGIIRQEVSNTKEIKDLVVINLFYSKTFNNWNKNFVVSTLVLAIPLIMVIVNRLTFWKKNLTFDEQNAIISKEIEKRDKQ